MRARAVVVVAALIGLALVGACSPDVEAPAATPSPEQSAASTQTPDPTQEFAHCLDGQGVDALVRHGYVLVRDVVPEGGSALALADEALWRTLDDRPWVAMPSADELADLPEVQQAWETCVGEVPDFTQPQGSVAMNSNDWANLRYYVEEVVNVRRFAQCAKDHDHDWITGTDSRALVESREATGEELRAVFTDCLERGARMILPTVYCPDVVDGADREDCEAHQAFLEFRDHWLGL